MAWNPAYTFNPYIRKYDEQWWEIRIKNIWYSANMFKLPSKPFWMVPERQVVFAVSLCRTAPVSEFLEIAAGVNRLWECKGGERWDKR